MSACDDRVCSQDFRVEFTATGTPLMVVHETNARLTTGLAEVMQVGGSSVAVVGSSGPSDREHRTPKVGQVLTPMPLSCTIRQGCGWFIVDGRAAAVKSSFVQVPDAASPIKKGVIETDNDFFFVLGEPLVRGG